MLWYKRPMRVIDLALEDPEGIWLDKWTPDELVQTLVATKANVLDMMVVNEWGQAYFNSPYLPKHPKLGDRDLLREVLDAASRADIRVLGMWGPSLNPTLYEQHPDWAKRDRDDKLHRWEHPELEPWIFLCHNSPYGELVMQALDDLFEKYELAGISFDYFVTSPCFCGYCREKYLTETGINLGQRDAWAENDYRAFTQWSDSNAGVWVKRVSTLAERHGRILVHSSSAREEGHVNFAEPHMGDHITIRDKGYHIRRTVAAARASDHATVICSPYAHMYFIGLPKPPAQMRQEYREIVISGAWPWPVIWDWEFVKDKRGFPPLAEVYDEMVAHEELLTNTQPLKYAALLISSQTINSPVDPDEKHYDRVKAFYDSVTTGHLPLEIVLDADLTVERLAGYKTLILPNARCLTDAQVAAVDSFVAHGGGLVASYETSLAQEEGKPREDFALDCLGCSYQGAVEAWWTYVRMTEEHAVVQPLEPGFSMLHGYYTEVQSQIEQAVREKRETLSDMSSPAARQLKVTPSADCQILATIQRAARPRESNFLKDVAPGTPGEDTGLPAIVVRQFGKGRVVYFPGQLDLVAYNVGHPDYEALLLNAVAWAGGPPPVQVQAPRTVEAAFYELEKGRRKIIHLLNHSYDQLFSVPRQGKNEQTAAVGRAIAEVVPVRGVSIVVTTPGGVSIERAFAHVTRRELAVQSDEDYVRIQVGDLHEYELVEVVLRRE